MKVRRKFSLDRIGKRFESIDFEVEAPTIEECVQEIEEAWRFYSQKIVDGKVS